MEEIPEFGGNNSGLKLTGYRKEKQTSMKLKKSRRGRNHVLSPINMRRRQRRLSSVQIEQKEIRRVLIKNFKGQKSTKKKGLRHKLSVHFGNDNWNMVLNMMIGIRASIIQIYNKKLKPDEKKK